MPGYKNANRTPRRTRTPSLDHLDIHNKHWEEIDQGNEYLNYNGTDPELQIAKLKQMAYQEYLPHDLRKRIMWEAFRDGFFYGIEETRSARSSEERWKSVNFWVRHREDDKLLKQFNETKHNLLKNAKAEGLKIDSQEAEDLIRIPFTEGYAHGINDSMGTAALLRSAVGLSHTPNTDEYRAHLERLLPANYKTYGEILSEILANARNDRDATEAHANSLRGRLTNTIRTLGSKLYRSMPVLPVDPEFTEVNQGHVLGRAGKKKTRRRRKNRK